MLFSLLTLHAIIGITGVAFHRVLGRWGFALAAVPAAATLIAIAPDVPAILDGEPVESSVEWVPQLGLALDLRLDAFALVMVLLVSGIGFLVCCYALSYFSHPKPGTGRLAGLLTLFAGSMLGVVLSDQLLSLFVFWELTTVTSYLLIGNDDRNPQARNSALMAILITGAGGLAMLAGFVIVGQSASTYRISELADAGLAGGTLIDVAVVCILIGAFTKSAQFPFSAWLPGAMVAPTPISTYLHAATMVKAGVFLVARLAPSLHTFGAWEALVVGAGAITMVTGGWRALRQHDLKLLLAYGTVSQLGFMMLLLGVGAVEPAQAGVVLLLAHGAFKAALFMVVGVVDHQAGTRDIRDLHRFGRGWAPVWVIAIASAASMAGVPPMLGFIAKEKALEAATHETAVMLVAIVVGSVLTFAYSGRFVLGAMGKMADSSRPSAGAKPDESGTSHAPPEAPAPGWLFIAPAGLLTAFTIVAGLYPAIIDHLVSAATEALYVGSHPKHLHLWAGWNTAFTLSLVIMAVGAALVLARRSVEAAQQSFHRVVAPTPPSDRIFWACVNGLAGSSKRVTAVVQNGSLPVYLMIILAVAALAPLGPALSELGEWPDPIGSPIYVAFAAIIVPCAIGATVVRRRIAAALMLGAVGYAMAGLFIAYGAPDLALTQFAIETLATVLFVLVLRFLPRRFDDRRPPIIAPLRLAVSILVGAAVFVFAIVASGSRDDVAAPSISDAMITSAVPEGDGSNVVNVVLVDFRGMDTLGEITVLVVAALGAVALARVAFRRGPGAAAPGSGFARLPVVTASSRLLFASIMVLSVYFLFAGHNQPGGGFVGGLTAGAAICLRYISGGVTSVRASFRMPPWALLGTGLAISVATAITPLLLGESVLEHAKFEETLPLLGKVKVTSALVFDIGVYLVVVGLVLMAFEAFGDDVDDADEFDDDGGDAGEPDRAAVESGRLTDPVGSAGS